MAAYVPNTVVKVLKDVPLDDTYTDTRWFSSIGDQTGFFSGKAKYTFTDMTYQRVNNGVAQPRVALTCRVPRIADDLYDCNYMMFQNTNYGTKWFYAFIKQVNYINPNNTEIVYEIDYLQTFMFELKIQPSFVEREHASAEEDKPFANLTPEPVEVGCWAEDVNNHYRLDLSKMGIEHNDTIVIAVIPNSAISSLIVGKTGAIYSGVYSGADYLPFHTAEDANQFIDSMAALDQADAIVDVFMAPIPPVERDGSKPVDIDTGINIKDETFLTVRGSYTIRNKKLLNSQFTYIKGSSDSGDSQEWKPELCSLLADTFQGTCEVGTLPTFSMYFMPDYMGYTGSGKQNVEYGINFSQSVHTVWNSNAWLGEIIKDSLKIAAGFLVGGAVGGAIGGAVTGGMAGGTAGAGTSLAVQSTALVPGTVSGPSVYLPWETMGATGGAALGASHTNIGRAVGNQLGNVTELFKYKAGGSRGNNPVDAMAFAMHLHGFEFRRMCPDKDTLEKLDTFFDMFGYQVNKVKMPNLDTRAAWNYVKLNHPCIYGSVPVEGMSIIKEAFAKGIRLWHVDAVGDYSIQNPPK